MIVTLAAVLSLASSMAMDVPYLAQTDALCGGAAAAMVFRYWGDVHADPQEFAPIVDRRAGGIAAGAFVDAVRRRGWRTVELAGGSADLQARLDARQPVVVLIADRGPRYHYVVAVGKTADAVVIHDPAWGPSRAIKDVEFDRIWRASGNWGVVILPPAASFPDSASSPTARAGGATLSGPESHCDSLLAAALDDIRTSGNAAFDRADDVLARVRQACPQSAGPLRELAGVRFAQRRWKDAAALSRAALVREPTDAYALDVLGSSLFMQDDQLGALRAWNRIDRPRVNLVRISGVRHTRHQTITETLGLQPNMLLTADVFEHAQRRLESLPDRSTVRLALRPEADGFASVDVVVVERTGVPRTTADWTGVGARALATQSVAVALPGGTGQGELWSADWRFWQNRPRVGMAFETSRVGRLPGVWRVDTFWERETFSPAGTATVFPIEESRLHGALTVSNWLTPRLRYSISGGFDTWSGNRKTAVVGGVIERRWFGDRAAIDVHANDWIGVGGSRGFQSLGWRLHVRSSPEPRGWVALAIVGADRVTSAAPLGLWPGAGDGQTRAPLLRAHPLTEDGVIALGSSAAFGRSLTYGSAEIQRWFSRPWLAHVGMAGFVDVARSARREAGDTSPVYVDVGTGLRLRIPGMPGALRIDAAHGLRNRAQALTLGWQF
jgi:predicted double-glycine peptidase